MAVILLSDSAVTTLDVSGEKVVKIVTPATADDGDTIDVSSLFGVGFFGTVSGASDGAITEAGIYSSLTVTIPGATDNEARTIILAGE